MFAIQNIQIVGCAVATTDHPRWDDGGQHYGIGGVIGLTPGGWRDWDGNFMAIGVTGGFWSSTIYNIPTPPHALLRYLSYDASSVNTQDGAHELGFSVRAVRNATAIEKAYHDGEIIINDYQDGQGNYYNSVKIGEQIWTTSNLKSINYQTGGAIDHITGNSAWAAATAGAYCFYENDYSNYGKHYGALYNWFAVDSGLVGGSWRVPSDADWTNLTNYVIKEFGYMGFTSSNVAVFLKSCRQVNHPKA